MVEGVVARQINHLQHEVARFHCLHPTILTVDVTRQRFRPLIAEIETDAATVVVEVELVVLVGSAHLGRIDRQ